MDILEFAFKLIFSHQKASSFFTKALQGIPELRGLLNVFKGSKALQETLLNKAKRNELKSRVSKEVNKVIAQFSYETLFNSASKAVKNEILNSTPFARQLVTWNNKVKVKLENNSLKFENIFKEPDKAYIDIKVGLTSTALNEGIFIPYFQNNINNVRGNIIGTITCSFKTNPNKYYTYYDRNYKQWLDMVLNAKPIIGQGAFSILKGHSFNKLGISGGKRQARSMIKKYNQPTKRINIASVNRIQRIKKGLVNNAFYK